MDNGLMCPEAFANSQTPYYVDADAESLIVQPQIVCPITLKSFDQQADATISCAGFQAGAAYPYTGAINLSPGESSVAPAADGLTIRAVVGGVQVEVGTNGQATNNLMIAGASGLSQVYDVSYNAPIKAVPVATYTGSIPANTGPGLWTYTPTRTGAYMLQVNFNVENADSIPINGAIEWVLNVGGGEVQYCSNTLKSTSISKASDFDEVNGAPGVLAPPMDYSFSNMAILTAGQQVSFYLATARNSAAGGGAWAVSNYQVRLLQCC